jgi:hypothetical protein
MPQVDGEFVWRMEAILDLYAAAYDPRLPGICFDEMPVQLLGETRTPQPCRPGLPQRIDYEYKRNGTGEPAGSLFAFFQPAKGWRQLNVSARRTKLDFAHCMQELVDDCFPQADKIRIVLDNLNTPTPASLYEAFAPAEAHRILSQLEFYYTPNHASWLNRVEIEFSLLSAQCLDRRIPDVNALRTELAAWQCERNRLRATLNWQFTNQKAREKMHRLYPS